MPGTHIAGRMCELDKGVLERYQAMQPETFTVIQRGGASIEVPWREGMLTREVKEFIEKETDVKKTQQRLMHKGTEYKVCTRTLSFVKPAGFANPIRDAGDE